MLLTAVEFLRRLEVLNNIPSGTLCKGECEGCLVRRVKDTIDLSETEITDMCCAAGYKPEMFGADSKASTDTKVVEFQGV